MIRNTWYVLQWIRRSPLWTSWIASIRERVARLRHCFSVSLWRVPCAESAEAQRFS